MYDIINETERTALRDAIDEAATTKLPVERTAVSNYDETIDANLQWITYKVHPIVQYAGHTNEKGEPDTFATNFMVTRTDTTEKRVTEAIRWIYYSFINNSFRYNDWLSHVPIRAKHRIASSELSQSLAKSTSLQDASIRPIDRHRSINFVTYTWIVIPNQ